MATLPAVTCIDRTPERTRYRLVGGTLAPEWAASVRPGHEAWCEITVYRDSDQLSSFGGEVWPAAWPDLFTPHRGNVQSGSYTTITAAGKALLASASGKEG